MSLKTNTVRPMVDSKIPDRILGSFWGRFFIVILQTVLVSQLLLLSFLVRLYVNITLLKYIVILLVGFLAGFSSRRFLTGHTRFLQLLAALISTALSLASLYILSAGFIGIDLFFRSTSNPDWQGLVQYGLAALGSLLVINAFRARPVIDEITSVPQPQKDSKHWLPKLAFSRTKKSGSEVARISPANIEGVTAKKSAKKKSPNTLAIQKTDAKLAVAAPSPSKTRQPAKRTKRNTKPEIKFIGKEEHICPYCLDPVLDHDPRGVKICPICKTRHHADCWGITGACQIPHSNEKKKH